MTLLALLLTAVLVWSGWYARGARFPYNIKQAQLYESIYREGAAKDDEALAAAAPQLVNSARVSDSKLVWDFWPERFTCVEGEERTHTANALDFDGGKWICGMRNILQRRDCVIYSFGSYGESSFEQAVLQQTACEVHTFDPTLNAGQAADVATIQGLHFHPWGLTSMNRSADRVAADSLVGGFEGMKNLPQIMQLLNHTWIDVLKIDIEGYENMVLQEFHSWEPPVTQLLVEMHLMNTAQVSSSHVDVLRTFVVLRAVGFKVFHREPNYQAPTPYSCWEYAFIRTDQHGNALVPHPASHKRTHL